MFAVASRSRHCFLVSLKKKEILFGFFEGLIFLSWKRTDTAYRLPATRLSGCKTGAPSQADVDRPDPQEVLVSKEACLGL